MEKMKQKRIQTKSLNISSKNVFSCIAVVFASFILGQGSLFEEIYPFGFALISASGGIYSFFALLGSSLGLIFAHSGVYLFRYIVCGFFLWLIGTSILKPQSKYGDMWFIRAGSCFAVISLTGIAVALPTGGGLEEILIFVSEALISSFLSFFYKRSIAAVSKREERVFSSEEIPCLYISLASLVAALAKFEFSGFSPTLFFAFFTVIVMAHVLSEAGGGISAAACAAALSGARAYNFNVLPLIFSGVVAGVFSPLGKIGCAFSFLLTFSATSLFTGEETAIQNIITAVICAIIFLIIPEKIYKKIGIYFKEKKAVSLESTYRRDVSDKLKQTSQAVENICDGMNKVSENLKKIDSDHDKNIFCRVRESVCSSCSGKSKCWNETFQYTLRGFDEMSRNYRSGSDYSSTPFGKLFLSKCQKSKELQESLTSNFKKYDEALREEMRLDEKRSLLTDQMRCMCDILNDFSKKFSRCSLVDNDLSQKVKEIFASFSVRCTKALCIVDTDGNMTIRANCKKIDREIDRKKLKTEIEEATLRKFSDPEIDFSDSGTTVIFKQKPWMKIRLGKIQLSSEDSPICGDCLREFRDSYGNLTLILSDGMGTGGRAAVDAAMTAEYFGALTQNSVSFDNSLKIINSVLDLKSTNESLATVDAARFNLFSGKVEFFKAGAAISFVRKNGKCSVVESASLPAGILRDVSFAKEKMMLSKGDIVVMVSDGVTGYKTDWIIKEIEEFNHSNPDILAQKIAGTVCSKSRGERRDDITVVVGIMTA